LQWEGFPKLNNPMIAGQLTSIITRFTEKSHTDHAPLQVLHKILSRALRISAFARGAISTAWASMCFFKTRLPRHLLARQRFFVGGVLAGLWAWVERRHGRGVFLYRARVRADLLWKVGVKRRWWRG
jgi:hypothetical protein